MSILTKFTFLMKSEPSWPAPRRRSLTWVIDERKCLSAAEVRSLRNSGKQAWKQGLKQRSFSRMRDSFMIELGLQTGLRVGEMVSLRHSDLLIDSTRSSIVAIGKGKKKRAIWISSGFKKSCLEYLSIKKDFGFNSDSEAPLLNNLHGGQISRRYLQKSFKKFLAKAGLSSHYHVHSLRHTYSTFLLKASNHNYRFVQQQLGHASIRTTQIYANVLENDGKIALERLYSNKDMG